MIPSEVDQCWYKGAVGAAIRGQRRPRCGVCLFNVADCVCGSLPRIDNTVEVVVVAHAHEIVRPSNTARFATRMLARSSLLIHGDGRRAVWSLAPEEPPLVLHPHGRPLVTADRARGLLVVPDGTWRHVGRMIKRVPLLLAGELVRVEGPPATELTVRKEPHPGHTSTLEAIARAMGVLESVEAEAVMLGALARVIDGMRRRRLVP